MIKEIAAKSRTFRLKVWGQNACFTRPEMKVERVSYDVITPSAARGILEAILWKPAIRWRITQIDVLNPIKWESVRRNEVGAVISIDNAFTTMSRGKGLLGIYIEDDRQQRAGLFLRDVAYTIHAYFEMTERAGPEDTLIKFEEMFLRRAEKGQCFHRPYFGCREFAAFFTPVLDDQPLPVPLNLDTELGWMLNDMDYKQKTPEALFFKATLKDGKMIVPLPESTEVRR
jgi:CRISPR-associated protein Cas5d